MFNKIFLEKLAGTEDYLESVFRCPAEDECDELVECGQLGITFFTKALWREEHSDILCALKVLASARFFFDSRNGPK